MRYEDWDILLFQKDSKVPLKEFKTQCHVVNDKEFAYSQRSYGLPTMTCFLPGLPTGTPFSISLHSWKTPELSHYAQTNFAEHAHLVEFEARVFVDGCTVTSATFDRTSPWPQLITHSFDFTKDGELDNLKWPSFRSELLRHSHWSPADELGRIKIMISECFPRDSLTVPTERVKNIVAFAFQHAPLDILECAAIAWPNPDMWRRGLFNPSMPVPSEHPKSGAELHLHSPRRKSSGLKPLSSSSAYSSAIPEAEQAQTSNLFGSMPNTQAFLQRDGMPSSSDTLEGWFSRYFPRTSSSSADWRSTGFEPIVPISNASYNPAVSGKRSKSDRVISSSNISMPDYVQDDPSASFHSLADFQDIDFLQGDQPQDADNSIAALHAPTDSPNLLPGQPLVDDLITEIARSESTGQGYSSYKGHDKSMKSPQRTMVRIASGKYNTKSTQATGLSSESFSHSTLGSINFPAELATSLTTALLNQPLPIPVPSGANLGQTAMAVKLRKENYTLQDTSTVDEDHSDMRKVSQSVFTNSTHCPTQDQRQDQVAPSRETGSMGSPVTNHTLIGTCSNRSVSDMEFDKTLNSSMQFTYPGTPVASATKAESGISSGMGPGSDKGTKRVRHHTPTSSKSIEDDEEPRQSSPHVRIGFGEGMAG